MYLRLWLVEERIQNQDTPCRKSLTSSYPGDREYFQSISTVVDNCEYGEECRAETTANVDPLEPKATPTPHEALGRAGTRENQSLPGWASRSTRN